MKKGMFTPSGALSTTSHMDVYVTSVNFYLFRKSSYRHIMHDEFDLMRNSYIYNTKITLLSYIIV